MLHIIASISTQLEYDENHIIMQVKCTDCGYESNTFEPFLDISLEINRSNTLLKALERFTSGEYLDGDNKYKCPKQVRGLHWSSGSFRIMAILYYN